MNDDLSFYQSSETAWRYNVRVSNLKQQINHVEEGLAVMKTELKNLLDHPPMYDLFNWSA